MPSITPAASQSASPAAGESFAALFEESLNRKEMRVGEVITAEVLSVDENFVVVNAGLKSESVIAVDEFRNDAGEVEVKAGDFVSVSIEALEDGYGATRLSRDKAKRMAAWLELEKALESGEKIKGVITGKVKGGLTVMARGIRAFLQRREQRLALGARGLFKNRAARHDHVVALAVELDDLELHLLAFVRRGVLHRTKIDQRARQ